MFSRLLGYGSPQTPTSDGTSSASSSSSSSSSSNSNAVVLRSSSTFGLSTQGASSTVCVLRSGCSSSPGDEDSELLDEWDILDDTPFSYVHSAAKDIFLTYDHGNANQVILKECLADLRKVKEIESPQEMETLKRYLIPAYSVMRNWQKDGRYATLENEISLTILQLKRSASYLTDHLATLTGFAALGADVAAGSLGRSQGKLLEVCGDSLVVQTSSTPDRQSATLCHLRAVETALKKPSACQHLTNDQLLKIKLAACWSMIAYLTQQKSGLDLVEHNFEALIRINARLDGILETRQTGGKFIADGNLKASFSLLSEQMQTLFFSDFWIDDRHAAHLELVEPYVNALLSFIANPKQEDLPGLVFLGRDDERGLALFEAEQAFVERGESSSCSSSSSESRTALKTYVALCHGRDGIMGYYNCLQSRKTGLSLGGLGHTPVFDSVDQTMIALKLLVSKHVYEDGPVPFKLITTGFGVDGAVAQVLAYAHACAHPDNEAVACCIGTAPYLDVNAAENLSGQENLYSVNLQLEGDTLQGVSAFSGYVAKTYSKNNWEATLPLYNRDWFLSDSMTFGHDPEIYREKVQRALRQPLQMRQVCHELSALGE